MSRPLTRAADFYLLFSLLFSLFFNGIDALLTCGATLITDGAAGLACRLATGLALTATDFAFFLQTGFNDSINVFHTNLQIYCINIIYYLNCSSN
jgi:hypothetical protein